MALRITQKQIAKALGLHPATVCLALKRRPEIPPETRERVWKMARKLGYRRDPFLGALSAYSRSRRKTTFHGTLAWIVSTSAGVDWRASREYVQYFEGAGSQAETLGYRIVVFDLNDYAGHPERLTGIFEARNIRGVIVCPQPKGNTRLGLDFSKISAVTFGYTIVNPVLHAVSSYHYGAIREIVARLKSAGYRRIGYAIPKFHDDRLNGAYLSGFLLEQSLMDPAGRLPPYTEDLRGCPCLPSSFKTWIREHRPDTLITVHYQAELLMKELGARVPSRLGIVLVSVVDSVRQFAGIDEDSGGIGRVAVDLLVSMVERGDSGVPEHPQRVLIKGVWQPGETLIL